jgi:hypothetical protein
MLQSKISMQRLINLALIISFLIVYLEWGKNNSTFLFQAEYHILLKKTDRISSFFHPLVLIPFCGQLIVLFTLFQRQPNRRLTTIGLIMMSILVLLITFVGLIDLNLRITLSTIPFIAISILHFRKSRKKT